LQEETLLEQKETHEMQKQKLLANHSTIMQRTLAGRAKAMLATRTLRRTHSNTANLASATRQADRERHQREMTMMANNHMHDKEAQIEHMKQQCAHWMGKRDKQMKEYVSQLNNFYR